MNGSLIKLKWSLCCLRNKYLSKTEIWQVCRPIQCIIPKASWRAGHSESGFISVATGMCAVDAGING